jgi:hypothetical protein
LAGTEVAGRRGVTGELAISEQDLAGLGDLPDHIRDSLVACGLPARFERFEVVFNVGSLRTAERNRRSVLILGETESGAIALDIEEGSVWWLQNEIVVPAELRAPAYRQFVNSDLAAFVRCVVECARIVQDRDPDSTSLEEVVRAHDHQALEAASEGVWRDVLLDWSAGL